MDKSTALRADGDSTDTDEHQRINRWKFHLGQEHSLAGGWGLNYGVRYNLTNDHSWQTFLPTGSNTAASPTNSYSRQNEDIVNIYAGSNGKIGEKLNFEVSLAAEYYHSPAWHQWNVYPTLSLTECLSHALADLHAQQRSHASAQRQ